MKPSLTNIYLLLFCLLIGMSCDKNAASSDSNSLSNGGGAGGSLARFTIVGNYLYMVDMHMLQVVDITNPATPEVKGQVYAGFDIETIFSYKNKLYLGASNGMYIYSINDPLKPVKESDITHFRACDPVVSNDTVSYVTLRSQGTNCGSNKDVLNIYDVKDPKKPKLVKEVAMKSPYGLGIRNKALFICEGSNGLVTFDLSDPYKPEKTTEFKDETFYDVIPYGDVLIGFIQKGVCFFDISDPLKPVFLSKVQG